MKLGAGEHVAVGTSGASGNGRSITGVLGKYGTHVLLTNALSKPAVLTTNRTSIR
jgi:hypothetical protein